MKFKTENVKLKNGGCCRTGAIRTAVLCLLTTVMLVSAFASRFNGAGPIERTVSAASGTSNSLSLVEISNEFDVMVLRATDNKTLIYVKKLYFDYSPLSSKRLKVTPNNIPLDDNTPDYVVINLTNEAGEWANTWGCVRQEEGVRPDDPLRRITTLTYLEINQYWEWRTFTNNERWTGTVDDGYISTGTVEFTFDLTDRKDGAIYHIDGYYGLPEHYYPQVAYWWDLTSANPDLMAIRDDYAERALAVAATTPSGEPLRLEAAEYNGKGCCRTGGISNASAGVAPMSYTGSVGGNGDGAAVEPMFAWGVLIAIVVVVVVVVAVVVAVTSKPETPMPNPSVDPYDPNQRTDSTPPAPTPDQRDNYEENKPELTPEEKIELEKRKEFSIDNDVPAGQKIAKLMVKDNDGTLRYVYDENGDELYVNRSTYAVGNATYAIINRETNLLIRYIPSSMELQDMVGNRITVNVDNKVMNMDGVQPFSPKSRDDILKKLGDMGVYTTSVDPARFLYRMDDDDALRKAMTFKENNTSKGFWATIGAAFKNLFGGGNTSKGFLSNFLDVLILIAVVLVAFLAVYFTIKGITALKKAKGG